MAPVTLPAQLFSPGETVLGPLAVGVPVTTFSYDVDCSLWVAAAQLEAILEVTYDGGTTWRHAMSETHDGPPPWPGLHGGPAVSHFFRTLTWPGGVTPTHVRLRVIISSQPLPAPPAVALTLGPSVITVS